jgi:hypothetical protein
MAVAVLVMLALTAPETIGPYLTVDLQGGFDGSRTFLFLEDSLVWRGEPVSSPIEGLAAGGIEMMCRSTLVELRLRAPGAGIDSSFTVLIPDGEYIGISLEGSPPGGRHIVLVQSGTPFGYD